MTRLRWMQLRELMDGLKWPEDWNVELRRVVSDEQGIELEIRATQERLAAMRIRPTESAEEVRGNMVEFIEKLKEDS